MWCGTGLYLQKQQKEYDGYIMHYTPGNMHRALSASPGQSCLTGGSSLFGRYPEYVSGIGAAETCELCQPFQPG